MTDTATEERRRIVRDRWVEGLLWTRSFGLCKVHLGPGAQYIHAGESETWAVWRHRVGDVVRSWLNAGTLPDDRGQLNRPIWSTHDQALYDGATAVALVLLFEDFYQEDLRFSPHRIGAIRLK